MIQSGVYALKALPEGGKRRRRRKRLLPNNLKSRRAKNALLYPLVMKKEEP